MAVSKTVEVKETAPKGLSRIFNRVDAVKLKLDHLYGDVPIEDRAVITVTPADPATRDELKQVELGWTVQQSQLCEMNDIPIVAMAYDWKPAQLKMPKKPKASASEKIQKKYLKELTAVRDADLVNKSLTERRAMAMVQYQKGVEASITSEETRAILARSLKVENYKECFLEGKEEVLKISQKSNEEIVATMPDDFVLMAFYKVMNISNLTQSEFVGL